MGVRAFDRSGGGNGGRDLFLAMPRSSPYFQGDGREIPFGNFAPDGDPTAPGILLDAQGAMPTIKGFRAMASPVAFGAPLPQLPTGGIVAYYSSGVSSLIVGTASHLYRYIGGVPTQADVGGAVGVPSGRWRFFQFGDDVIACAANQAPLVATGPTGTFGALTGSAPFGATVGCTAQGTALLFAGALWYSSAPSTDNNWTPSPQTLAATGQLYDYPGPVVAAVSFYNTVIAFKEVAIWLGQFIGPPDSWSWQLISDMTGTWCQESAVVLSDSVAFVGSDDFYETSGNVPQRIPNQCAEWFFQQANPAYLSNINGWYDEARSTLYWHFVSNAAPYTGVPDRFVSYNKRSRRWCTGYLNTPTIPAPPLFSAPNGAAIYFDINNVPQQLSGPAGPMRLTSGYLGDPDRLTQAFRWRPKYNFGQAIYPTSQSLAAFHTNVLGVAPTPSPTVPQLGGDGWFNFRQNDRWHQMSLATQGDCEVISYSYEGRLAGIR